MKIGIFTETFLPQVNGVVVSMCNVNKELIKMGHRITVFTVGDGERIVDGYDVYRFKGSVFKPYPEYKYFRPNFRDWSEMKKIDLDVIHSRTPFTLGVTAKNLSKKKQRPILGTFDTPMTDYVHYVPFLGSFWPTKNILEDMARRWTRKYYGWCDLVTVPSHTTKKSLLDMGFKNNIAVLSNGIDTKIFNPQKASHSLRKKICPNGESLILHVGRITKEKRVENLLKIAEILIGRGAKFKLLIIGNGPEFNRLKASSTKLKNSVIFAGYVSQKDLPKYYASADLFLTASTVETQGIVLLESLSSGLPVIGADAGAIPELVKGGKNGFLFGPEKPEQAADLAESVLRDENLRNRLSKNSNASVKEHEIGKVALKLEKIYKSLL